MHCVISGHHYHISDATREYIESQIARFEKFYNPLIDCQVTITKESNAFRSDIVVNVHGKQLKSSDENQKLYPAIDISVKKMISQLKKLHDLRRRPRAGAADPVQTPDVEG